jgi:hypothetical protein
MILLTCMTMALQTFSLSVKTLPSRTVIHKHGFTHTIVVTKLNIFGPDNYYSVENKGKVLTQSIKCGKIKIIGGLKL